MEVKCPYTKTELIDSMNSLEETGKLTEENSKIIGNDLEDYIKEIIGIHKDDENTTAAVNKACAKSLGISLIEFINSPNYDAILFSYKSEWSLKLIQRLEEKYKMTNLEAWSLYIAANSPEALT